MCTPFLPDSGVLDSKGYGAAPLTFGFGGISSAKGAFLKRKRGKSEVRST